MSQESKALKDFNASDAIAFRKFYRLHLPTLFALSADQPFASSRKLPNLCEDACPELDLQMSCGEVGSSRSSRTYIKIEEVL